MLRQTIALLSTRGCGMVLTLAINLFIARQLPEVDYGFAIYAYTLIVLASMLSRNGNHIWIPRDMAKTTEYSKKISIAVCGVSQTLFYSIAIAALALVYLFLKQPFGEAGSVSKAFVGTLVIAGAIVVHSICETITSVLVGLKRQMLASFVSFILPNSLLLLTAFIFQIESFEKYTILLFCSYATVATASLIIAYSVNQPKLERRDLKVFSIAPLAAHFPITSVDLVMYLNANIDIIVLSNIGTPGDLALFGFVFKIGGSVAMLYFLPRMISGPVFSERFFAGDIVGVKREFRRITAIMASLGVLTATFIVLVFPYVGAFVGKYQDHNGVLFVVLLGAALNVMFGPLLLLLNMTEKNQSIWKYGAVFLLAKLMLLVVAYQYFDLFWYATAGAVMVVFWNLVLFFLTFVRLTALAGRPHLTSV